MTKALSLVLLAIGAVICFGAEKIAVKLLKDNSDGAQMKIKLAAYAVVLLALLVLFI